MTARAATAPVALSLVAAALCLAGCSGAASSSPAATPEWDDSPLENYLAPLYGDEDEAVREQAEWQVEYLTAACMANEGFEYTPDDPAPLTSADRYHPDDPSWVARWGYGVVEYPDRDGEPAFYRPLPNLAYVDSLDGAARGAYYSALFGAESTDGQVHGCYGAARRQLYGDDVTAAEGNASIVDALERFEASLDANTRLARIDAEWAECMAGYGYDDLGRQREASQSIYTAAAGIDVSDARQRDALHQQEIELALADLDCRRQVDYKNRYTRIQFTLEQRFLDDHRTELDAIIAEARAARRAASDG